MDKPNSRCTRNSKSNQDSQQYPGKIVENRFTTISDQNEKIVGNLKEITNLEHPHKKQKPASQDQEDLISKWNKGKPPEEGELNLQKRKP